MDERWYTVAQVAETLQVHPETVRRWLKSGQLEGRNFGGKTGWRIRERDIEAFLTDESGKVAA